MIAQDLIELLKQWKLRTTTEKTLQDDIATVLAGENIEFTREHRLTTIDVIDFRVGKVGIECKIAGAKTTVLRQLIRYASFPDVEEIILVTTKSSHRELDGEVVQGKRIRVCWINNL